MRNSKKNILSNKKAIIACDLFLPLRLYHLPDWLQDQLKVAFPNVEIVPVNTPESPLTIDDATVYWGNRITHEIIAKMPKLEWIHFGSVGVNRVNINELSEKHVLITSSKGLVVSSMVTSAVAFMTNLARGMHYSQKLRDSNCMTRNEFDKYFDQIHELSGERCLIVGFGDVGKKLSKVCQALEMHVSVVSRSLIVDESIDVFFTLDELSAAVFEADYVVNLLPLNDETNQVFTQNVFSKMKSSAFFINIGRGETVDEDALISALENNIITGAGLDVFAQEPLSIDSPLWTMDSVVLSPHVAGLSKGYWDRQATLFIKNLELYLNGKHGSLINIMNTDFNGTLK